MKQKDKSPEHKQLKKELLTDEDVMLILGISKDSLRRWREKGYIPFIKIGTRYYYPSKLFKIAIRDSIHPYYKRKNKETALDIVTKSTNTTV